MNKINTNFFTIILLYFILSTFKATNSNYYKQESDSQLDNTQISRIKDGTITIYFQAKSLWFMPRNVKNEFTYFNNTMTNTVSKEIGISRIRLWDIYTGTDKDTKHDSDNWVYYTYNIFYNRNQLPPTPESIIHQDKKTTNSQLLQFCLFEICVKESFDFQTLQTFTLNQSDFKAKNNCFYPTQLCIQKVWNEMATFVGDVKEKEITSCMINSSKEPQTTSCETIDCINLDNLYNKENFMFEQNVNQVKDKKLLRLNKITTNFFLVYVNGDYLQNAGFNTYSLLEFCGILQSYRGKADENCKRWADIEKNTDLASIYYQMSVMIGVFILSILSWYFWEKCSMDKVEDEREDVLMYRKMLKKIKTKQRDTTETNQSIKNEKRKTVTKSKSMKFIRKTLDGLDLVGYSGISESVVKFDEANKKRLKNLTATSKTDATFLDQNKQKTGDFTQDNFGIGFATDRESLNLINPNDIFKSIAEEDNFVTIHENNESYDINTGKISLKRNSGKLSPLINKSKSQTFMIRNSGEVQSNETNILKDAINRIRLLSEESKPSI